MKRVTMFFISIILAMTFLSAAASFSSHKLSAQDNHPFCLYSQGYDCAFVTWFGSRFQDGFTPNVTQQATWTFSEICRAVDPGCAADDSYLCIGTSQGGCDIRRYDKFSTPYDEFGDYGVFTAQANTTYHLTYYRDFGSIQRLNGAINFHQNEWDPADDVCGEPAVFSFDVGHSIYGKLEFSGDEDWHLLHVHDYGEMNVTLDVPYDKNYELEVWNDQCQPLQTSNGPTGAGESVLIGVQPGSYWVRVRGFNPNIDFGHTFLPDQPDNVTYHEASVFGTGLGGDPDDDACEYPATFVYPVGHSVSGDLEMSGDNDWHLIQIPEGISVAKIYVTLDVPPHKNYDIALLDSSCQVLRSSQKGTGWTEYVGHLVTGGQSYWTHIYGATPGDFNDPYVETSTLVFPPVP